MDDLVTFLRARLDEDQRVAATAGGGDDCGAWTAAGETVDFDQYEIGGFHPSTAAHVARHDPARVLREVEAKRRLLEQFTLRGDSVRRTVQPSTGGVWDDLLRMLALPYAGHPDYREEWRP